MECVLLVYVFFKGLGHWSSDEFVDGCSCPVTYTKTANGVFSLSEGDALTYRHTKSLAGITTLCPCDHPDSVFIRTFGKDAHALKYEDDYTFSIEYPEDPTNIISIAEPAPIQKLKQKLTESERNTLLKLVLGMAIDCYKYDPEKLRNEATGGNKGSIQAALTRCGLEIDQKTIALYLKEASEKFPAKPLKH